MEDFEKPQSDSETTPDISDLLDQEATEPSFSYDDTKAIARIRIPDYGLRELHDVELTEPDTTFSYFSGYNRENNEYIEFIVIENPPQQSEPYTVIEVKVNGVVLYPTEDRTLQ